MSDLKYLNEEQLKKARTDSLDYISRLERKIGDIEKQLSTIKSHISGQQERLKWIDKYLALKRKTYTVEIRIKSDTTGTEIVDETLKVTASDLIARIRQLACEARQYIHDLENDTDEDE